jgi:hypothetical protein
VVPGPFHRGLLCRESCGENWIMASQRAEIDGEIGITTRTAPSDGPLVSFIPEACQ